MTADPIDVLLRHGEEHGCIHMTELYELAQRLEVDDDELQSSSTASRPAVST